MSIIKDVATLVNAGFTLADVKEIIAAEKAAPGDTIQGAAPAADAGTPAPAAENDKEDETDYKALYEETQKRLDQLQKANTKENIKPDPVDREELFKSIKNKL